MVRCQLMLACLALAAISSAQARVFSSDVAHTRSLKQGAQAFCPDGCATDGCVQDATKGGLRCQKCDGNLVVNKVTGNCACPAGTWVSYDAAGKPRCSDCAKGSYCPGSDYFLATNSLNPLRSTSPGLPAPQPVPCPLGTNGRNMTTLGKRATSQRACVNLPGSYYVINGETIDQVDCPVDTYSPGLKKQRACVPCPTGYTTNGKTMQSSPVACVVPAGYFLKGPGQVAPCPRGEWKTGVDPSGNCTKCAFGVTTAREASISIDNCTIVVRGYFATAMRNGIVTGTKACPQNYYCPGGIPTQPFNVLSPNPDTAPVSGRKLQQTSGTIFRCPYGMWTQSWGSTDVEQCLTPPGFFTNATGTYQCANGTYRPDWLPYGQATSCFSCGDDVKTVQTDRVSVYNMSRPEYDETFLPVTSSSDDCYIMPGQGLYYTTLTKSWRVKNCTVNAYGVNNVTYGLTPSPCRDCPTNMVTSLTAPNASFPTSAQYFVRNGDTEGFIDPMACVTIAGYGYNGRVAQACKQGFFNGADNYNDCQSCEQVVGFGFTTEGVGKGVSSASCGVAAGYGYNATEGKVLECPIGYFNNVTWTQSNRTTCIECPTGLTTKNAGSTSAGQCNYCDPGYGGAGCQSACGGDPFVNPVETATYGPIDRSTDTDPSCLACTTQSTGYSFEWNSGNDIWASPAVSKPYASAATDCVAKFSQISDQQWYIPVEEGDPYVVIEQSVNSFTDCVNTCQPDGVRSCQFVTYDYNKKTCLRRMHQPPTYIGAPLLGLKNLPSGDVGTNVWSLEDNTAEGRRLKDQLTKAKLVTTGVYSFYRDESLEADQRPGVDLGTLYSPEDLGMDPMLPSTDPTYLDSTATKSGLQECLNRCDDKVECFGIKILMNVNITQRPTTCRLMFGNTKPGTFLRSVIRADTARMPLPSLASDT